jgi:hypothetical protein
MDADARDEILPRRKFYTSGKMGGGGAFVIGECVEK